MTADSVRARLGEPVANLWLAFDHQLFALSPQASRLLAILVTAASALMGVVMLRIVATTAVMSAAAQSGGSSGGADPRVQGVLCESAIPIDTLIAFGLAAISMFLLVKAIMQGTVAFNKLGSSRAQQQFEGKQALAGAGKTAAGAFVPPLFVAVLNTIFPDQMIAQCLMNGLTGGNIFGTIAVLPF
ncbi:hypothetical protein [Halorientalis pallida]|uniref:Uncharacterized protein n=1 Tax=Halorientalis pallida TaxID=2479928 RepID=A0A498KRR3_9EURY|nr:hypothetical protein [Halorientalis pallida]RXK47267.1 hypothetical protein EAF64_15905 [Halorientalis pallida]